jgi:hypothetical protein
MKCICVGALALAIGAATAVSAQSLDDLNIQFHRYPALGFLYTTNDNIRTTQYRRPTA